MVFGPKAQAGQAPQPKPAAIILFGYIGVYTLSTGLHPGSMMEEPSVLLARAAHLTWQFRGLFFEGSISAGLLATAPNIAAIGLRISLR